MTSYAEAAGELKVLLGEIEGGGLDVDAVGEKVARARELIEFCRSRVRAARAEVQRVGIGSEG